MCETKNSHAQARRFSNWRISDKKKDPVFTKSFLFLEYYVILYGSKTELDCEPFDSSLENYVILYGSKTG